MLKIIKFFCVGFIYTLFFALCTDILRATPAVGNLTVVFDALNSENDLSWDAVEPSTDNITILYEINVQEGRIWRVGASSETFFTQSTSLSHPIGIKMDYIYRVRAYDSGPVSQGGGGWGPYNAVVSYFADNFKRGGFGTGEEDSQLGMGPMWKIKYQLEDDAYVTFAIYPPSTTFLNTDSYGYPLRDSATNPQIRLISENVPRSNKLADSSWWNTEEWDCKDSSGVFVSNGIYVFFLECYDKHYRNISPPAPNYRTGPQVGTIPVDLLRIMNYYANTVSGVQAQNVFHFKLTGDAEVKIKVYPGSTTFSGVDNSTSSLTYGEAIPQGSTTPLKTMQFYRSFGELDIEWDGKDDRGNYLANGLYKWTISAKIEQPLGQTRYATNALGNDLAMWSMVSVERSTGIATPLTDELKIEDFYANTITTTSAQEVFNLKLSGTAALKIKIYDSSSTFSYIDKVSTSPAYGEAVPQVSTKVYKALTFFRSKGDWSLEWDGRDEAGNFLSNGLYKWTVSGQADIDGTIKIATDRNGNEAPLWGLLAVDRSTAASSGTGPAQQSQYPEISLYGPAAGGTLVSPPSEIAVRVTGSGFNINWSSSVIIVFDQDEKVIYGEKVIEGDLLKLRLSAQAFTRNGVYRVQSYIYYNDDKLRAESFSFTLSAPQLSGSFKSGVYAYPNPARSYAKIKYPGSGSARVMIFDLLGNLLREERTPGTFNWDLKNSSGEDLADGVYILKLRTDDGNEAIKPLMVKR